jgi:hypothetical protein
VDIFRINATTLRRCAIMESRIRSGVLVRKASQELKKKSSNIVHWVALFVLVLCPIGGYMSYDAPGALSVFYSMYKWREGEDIESLLQFANFI